MDARPKREDDQAETGKDFKRDALFFSKAAAEVAASAIPFVGGPLATAIGIWEGERISRRVEAFIADVRERIARLDEGKLDSSYVESEAYRDVAIAAIQSAKRSSEQEKRRWLAGVLIGAATVDRPSDLDAEALLNTLGGLTLREVLILRWVHGRLAQSFHVSELPAELKGTDVDFHMHRLEAAGMINYVADRPTKGYDWRIYATTATFERMMKLVDAVDES